MDRVVRVVPHTHWDREWYKPFPVFRMQLVELLDSLLDTLDADPDYEHFQLDGQMALIDDYLEIRPHQRARLERLNAADRISMGPWYTLPDEFLVSGETHIRNLRLGLSRAAELGGAMEVGYLPDMFGHVAQMPQILAGFGFEHAVVWRGVPKAIEAPAFWWEAPDGSRIRAEYLADGYSNGARLPADGSGLISQVAAFRQAHGRRVGPAVLWMNGSDHQLPDPRLVEVVAEANKIGERSDGDRYEITSLARHLATASTEGLPTWSGELRSGARSNLLMGVASCRVDVKQAAATAELWLERVAEPLSSAWLPAEEWPREFLATAWLGVIRNAAHDSICGCSVDEVNNAVLHRYSEATLVADALTTRALVRVLAASAQPRIVVNPAARTRSATVTAVISGDIAPPNTQQVSLRPAVHVDAPLPAGPAVPVVLRAATDDPRISQILLERDARGHHGSEDDHDQAWTARLIANRADKEMDLLALRTSLEGIAAVPGATITIETVRNHATQEVLLRTAEVPGLGWRGLAPTELGENAVRPHGQGLTNGLVTVEVDQTSGTFSINGHAGLGRLVDDGDAGDTYNWSPSLDRTAVSRPDHVDVAVSEAGPVRGRIHVTRTYSWPTAVVDGYRVGLVEVDVRTEIEVHACEDLVRLRVSFDNPCRDHRLRMHFDLPERAEVSEAECSFGTVTRSRTAEGGPNEVGLATFPSRRFVRAGGLLVAHHGLSEYELVDDELAVTLLRSVGVISRGPMEMRAVPAGPPSPTPGAQMIGRHVAELVLHVGERDPYDVAEDAFTPMLTANGLTTGTGGRPGFGDPEAHGQALSIRGAQVSALTRRDDGRLEVRAFNPTSTPSELIIEGGRGVVTDLRGEPSGQAFDGNLPLGPHKIVTIALD